MTLPDDTLTSKPPAETVDPEPAQGAPAQPATGETAEPEPASSDRSTDGDASGFADDDYNAVVAALPQEVKDQLNKVLTQKFQKASSLAKVAAGFEQFIEAYRANPEVAARALAIQHGLLKDESATPAPETAKAGLLAEMKSALGEDLEFLAERLAPVLEKYVQPFTEQAAVLEQTARQRQVDADLAALTAEFPDWKQYESEMMKIGQTLVPAKGAKGLDYLRNLYRLASAGKGTAAAAGKIVKKMVEGAQAAGSPKATTPASRVDAATNRPVTLREALELAKKGVRL